MKKLLAKKERKSPIDTGQVLLAWEFPHYEHYPKSKRWVIIMTLILLVFLIYAIFTANYLFAVVLLIAAFVVVLQHYQEAPISKIIITETGIAIDGKFYLFKQVESFWIIYEPPEVKSLYLRFKSGWNNQVTIPLLDMDPILVRELLSDFIFEDLDKEDEEYHESISRIIGLK